MSDEQAHFELHKHRTHKVTARPAFKRGYIDPQPVRNSYMPTPGKTIVALALGVIAVLTLANRVTRYLTWYNDAIVKTVLWSLPTLLLGGGVGILWLRRIWSQNDEQRRAVEAMERRLNNPGYSNHAHAATSRPLPADEPATSPQDLIMPTERAPFSGNLISLAASAEPSRPRNAAAQAAAVELEQQSSILAQRLSGIGDSSIRKAAPRVVAEPVTPRPLIAAQAQPVETPTPMIQPPAPARVQTVVTAPTVPTPAPRPQLVDDVRFLPERRLVPKIERRRVKLPVKPSAA